jgi:predicted Kef-type K+ transport protein
VEDSLRLIELGAVILGLALLSRVAQRVGLSPIPLYLLAGLAFGRGGFLPLVTSEQFIEVGMRVDRLGNSQQCFTVVSHLASLERVSDPVGDDLSHLLDITIKPAGWI